ncbi:MAG: hypothetical protein UHM23_03575 [Clostridia bacterium]|nr:hypothetical protein [Clostridia bacterium]
MKNLIKKFTVMLSVLSLSLMLTATVANATDGFRSGPGEGVSVTDTTKDAENTNDDKTTSQASSASQAPSSVTTQANTQNAPAKKYLTKWGGFFWFLLSVIVNFILSCWVGNRFYQLSRRNSQSSAEIRALRKDIEERFASTLTDIDEPITEVINRNESYARTDEGMEMPERRKSVEINEEEREILGRWDTKRSASRDFEGASESVDARSYSPTRAMSGIEFEDDEAEDDAVDMPKRGSAHLKETMETVAKAGSKAKDFLSNIFPFED